MTSHSCAYAHALKIGILGVSKLLTICDSRCLNVPETEERETLEYFTYEEIKHGFQEFLQDWNTLNLRENLIRMKPSLKKTKHILCCAT